MLSVIPAVVEVPHHLASDDFACDVDEEMWPWGSMAVYCSSIPSLTIPYNTICVHE